MASIGSTLKVHKVVQALPARGPAGLRPGSSKPCRGALLFAVPLPTATASEPPTPRTAGLAEKGEHWLEPEMSQSSSYRHIGMTSACHTMPSTKNGASSTRGTSIGDLFFSFGGRASTYTGQRTEHSHHTSRLESFLAVSWTCACGVNSTRTKKAGKPMSDPAQRSALRDVP